MSNADFNEVLEKLPTHLQEQVYAFAKFLLEADTPQKSVPPFVLGLHEGLVEISEDFDAPLSEAFWLGEM